MNRMAMVLVALAPALAGCAMDPGELDEVGEAEGEVAIGNSLTDNGLTWNGLTWNGLTWNQLSPGTISSGNLSTLQGPGKAGADARQLLKYMVGCAFDAQHSFSLTWHDASGDHQETYWGSLGLATEWQETALSEEGQRWVSACLAARANHYGLSVQVSLRSAAASPALDVSADEVAAFPYLEGTFWGNLFSDTPELHSCYQDENAAHSRSKRRVCAAGYASGPGMAYCANIQSVGSCASVCTPAADPAEGYASCGAEARVLSVFLD